MHLKNGHKNKQAASETYCSRRFIWFISIVWWGSRVWLGMYVGILEQSLYNGSILARFHQTFKDRRLVFASPGLWTMASSIVDSAPPPPGVFFVLPTSNPMLTSYTDCGRAFVWEMIYSWKGQIVLGGGNILTKVKIKCSAGQKLEIMTFIHLKTLVFDKFF